MAQAREWWLLATLLPMGPLRAQLKTERSAVAE